MENKQYSLGLLKKNQLINKGNNVFEYVSVSKESNIKVICNLTDNTTTLLRKLQDEDNFIEDEIEKNVIKQISEDGSRWEGDWLNGFPFGFGSLFDGDGNRIYSGFMFEGKKIGFGTEYFADNHKVDYSGNFINDKRHGWGTTYDRNGQKLYEGDWRCGKNCDFEDKIVIKDNCEEDCLRIHDLIKALEIGENCFNEWEDDLIIKNYPNLQSIVVKKDSLQNLNSLKICNCEKLKTIEVENKDYWGEGAFYNVKNVIIESF